MTIRRRVHIQMPPEVTLRDPGSTAEGWPFYIQDDPPANPPEQYAWLQTNYLAPGKQTLWIKGGV